MWCVWVFNRLFGVYLPIGEYSHLSKEEAIAARNKLLKAFPDKSFISLPE